MSNRPHIPLPMAQNAFLNALVWVVAYVALDYISFVESFRGLAITPWSPAAGLALALVLLGGWRYAPVVLVAPALAGVLVRAGSVPVPVHLVEGLLFGGSYLAAGLLIRRYGNLDPRLLAARDTLMLMLTALVAAAMAATAYVGVLWLAGLLMHTEIVEGFVRFIVGDLIGMLIVAPVVLLAVTRRLGTILVWEAPLQFLTILFAFAAVFAVPHASEYQLFYLLFVPLLWCTFRSGLAGAVAALCIVQIGLILVLHIRDGAMAELTSFQVLMISLAATGLVFGSMVEEQRATALRLRHQQLALTRALRLRSMGEIATAIAHEVNQPITSIRTFAGIAKNALDESKHERAVDAMGRIRQECDRASSIIRATRDVLRQEVSRPQPIQVDQVLAKIEELLQDRLGPGNIELSAQVNPAARTVTGDPVQITQALYNIVDNSIDAIEGVGTGGRITIVVEPAGRSAVEFVVRDSGPGFAQELLGDDITPLVSTKPNGTGIGLSIARSIAEVHGGGLTVGREGDKSVVRLRIATSAPASEVVPE